MISAPDKNNYLTQINGHFLSCINTRNELINLTDDEISLAKIQSALNSVRHCIEGIVNYIILEKVPLTDNPNTKIKKALWEKIFYLYDKEIYDDSNATADKQLKEKHTNNATKLGEFTKLRFGGNDGSHSSPDIKNNPTLRDYTSNAELLKDVITWFYNKFSLPISDKITNAIEKNIVNPEDIVEYHDWYFFSSQYENFKAKNTQYVLFTSSNLNENLSLPQLQNFIKSDIDWHLIIDFDENSQNSDTGLCKLFNNEFGIENIRVYTPLTDENKIDFTVSPNNFLTFFYLAQEPVPVTNVKQWNKVNGKKLDSIIFKSRAKSVHSNLVLICLFDSSDFLDSIFDIFSNSYGSETNKIQIAIISSKLNVIDSLKHDLSDFNTVFKSINYFLINSNELIEGFSKNKKNKLDIEGDVIIPAYTPEQEDT